MSRRVVILTDDDVARIDGFLVTHSALADDLRSMLAAAPTWRDAVEMGAELLRLRHRIDPEVREQNALADIDAVFSVLALAGGRTQAGDEDYSPEVDTR